MAFLMNYVMITNTGPHTFQVVQCSDQRIFSFSQDVRFALNMASIHATGCIVVRLHRISELPTIVFLWFAQRIGHADIYTSGKYQH